MRETRIVTDVTGLPTTTFGHRSMMWWGTVGYVLIEGTTLLICAGSYFYLRKNFATWPPEGVLRPGLTAAALQTALMLVSNVPMLIVDRAARRLDLRAVRTGMLICTVLALAMCAVRVFEFQALHLRWDSSAYGSVAWATLVTHSTLLLLETAETLAITALMFQPDVEARDLSGVSDNALYWYFLTGVWIPLYVMVFLSPYFM